MSKFSVFQKIIFGREMIMSVLHAAGRLSATYNAYVSVAQKSAIGHRMSAVDRSRRLLHATCQIADQLKASFGTSLQENFKISRKTKSCGRVFKVFAAGGKQGEEEKLKLNMKINMNFEQIFKCCLLICLAVVVVLLFFCSCWFCFCTCFL